MKPLRIGTRRSALALAQAEEIRGLLATRGIESEAVPMTTSGDEGSGAANGPGGMKGLWVDTILDALDSGQIDLAVHSAKDLPAEDEEGFVLAAVPVRADPSDLLICREEGQLPVGSRIGTSSLRRRASLLAAFTSFDVVDLRGNVDTRLRKLEEGEVDAVVLAAAGLARLGISPPHTKRLPLEAMVPAPGQGALALQVRAEDEETLAALEDLNDRPSRRELETERSVVWRLGGDCALPLGALAQSDGDRLRCTAMIATPDGTRMLRVEHEGDDPEEVAGAVARDLIGQGAEAILAQARNAQ